MIIRVKNSSFNKEVFDGSYFFLTSKTVEKEIVLF